MFVDSFLDDLTYIRDVEVCGESGLLHTSITLSQMNPVHALLDPFFKTNFSIILLYVFVCSE